MQHVIVTDMVAAMRTDKNTDTDTDIDMGMDTDVDMDMDTDMNTDVDTDAYNIKTCTRTLGVDTDFVICENI
jgi:hypothetical protein